MLAARRPRAAPHAAQGELRTAPRAGRAPCRTCAGEVQAAFVTGGLPAGHASRRTPRWASSVPAQFVCCIQAGRAARWPRAWGGVGRSHSCSAACGERDLVTGMGGEGMAPVEEKLREQASRSAVAQTAE